MALLLDQFGRPIEAARPRPERATLYTPTQRDRWATYPSRGLTPGKLARILRAADQGYSAQQVELFRELEEKDAHVASQMQMRKQAVLRLEYDVHTDSDDPRAVKVAEFCRKALLGLEDLDDLLMELLDAIPQGWAMPELIWDVSSGQAVIAGFNRVPQERTCWPDETNIPRLATDADPIRGVEIPPFKVVFHRHRVRSAPPFRAGVMRTVVWWWMFKNYAVKDWAAFAEIFGMPLRVGKYEPGSNSDDRQALKQALLDLGVDGAAVISKDTEIEFKEAAARTAGKTVFEAFALYCNREMSKAILGQTLTSDVDKVGSYAAAKVHDNVREDLRDADAAALAKTLRQQVLLPLAVFNFGPDAPVPWFIFNIEEAEDLKEKSEVYSRLVEMGLPLPQMHVYEAFKVPAPEGDEIVLQKTGAAELLSNRALSLQVNSARDRARKAAQGAIERLGAAAARAAAVNLADLTGALEEAVAEAEDYDGLLASALRLFPRLKPGPVARVLEEAVVAAELNGRVSADHRSTQANSRGGARSPRIRPVGGPGGRNLLRSNARQGFRFIDKPLDPREAIRFFAEKPPVTPEVFARLTAQAKARAFTVAGVMQEDLLAELYHEVDKALREGTAFAEFQASAGELFARRGLAGPNPWHLETVFRNNIQSAYMAGRYHQMVDPEVLGRRPFWQYETVGDAQVRPEHAAQHGKVYPAQHPFWAFWYPPNGHNCRCDVISLSGQEVAARGLPVQKHMEGYPDEGWRFNVGEVGWGRGLADHALGVEYKRGPWRFREDLLRGGDPAPAVPPGAALPASLPPNAWELSERLKAAEIRDYYREQAITANGFGRDSMGKPLDLPLADVRGDREVLAARTLDHVLEQDADLARARYLTLARQVVEAADEVWLVPGSYSDGRVTMRRYYHKFFEGDGPDSLMVISEFTRGVWTGFNVLPLREREANKRRVGLLLHPQIGLP
jgi:SPP1 gp7 family putative phage head morphogenesis protein